MDTLATILTGIAGVLLGVGVGWWWRTRRTTPESNSSNGTIDALITALGSDDHGVALLAPAGRLLEATPDLARVLRTNLRETSAASPEPLEIDEWARDVMPEDRVAIRDWLDQRTPHAEPLSIRSVDHGDVRWLRLIYVRPVDRGEIVLIVDETRPIHQARRERLMLRNARLVADVADAVSVADSSESMLVDVLAILKEHLDLQSGTWFSIEAESREVALIASNLDGPNPTPSDQVIKAMQDPFGRLAGGLPCTLETPESRLLLPILVSGHLTDVIDLHATRPDTWDADTAEQLLLVADKVGRRIEQLIGEEEREAWASTRGSLERAEAIAQLTGNIAHDFNGVLFAIQGRLELLRSELGDGTIQADIDEIESAIVEAKRLAERLRSALRGDQEPIPINVATEIDTIVQSARRLLPGSLELEHHVEPAIRDEQIVLYAPANALEQILTHLIVNARDALKTRGRIMLGARLVEQDRLEIRIDDDGPGIPESDRTRMLEPYETGPDSVGTGLGLAICKRLVIQRQGSFELLESPLGGLAASMNFPIRRSQRHTTQSIDVPTGEARPHRVLVVEDNTIIRDVLVRVFEGIEAEVHARGDTSEVETILDAHPDTDLLVFDIDLPGRTGVECLEDLRARGVNIPCLLITGGMAEPPSLERIAFLRKPFRIDVLRRTASQLLNQPRP